MQRAFVEHLQYLGVPFNASKGGAAVGARVGAIYKARGVQAGWPDLHIVKFGARGEPGLFVEVKAARGPAMRVSVHDVPVTRGTVLGNPFRMRAERERDAVCDAYADWASGGEPAHVVAARWGVGGRSLWVHEATARVAPAARAHALREVAARVRAGECVRLQCRCAPRRCHGETVCALVRCYV